MQKRIQVYPTPKAVQVLGADREGDAGPRLNLAIEVYSRLVARAGAQIADRFTRGEWNLMADCCNGTLFQPEFSGREQIAANVEDSPELAAKWLGRTAGQGDLKDLAERVRALPELEGWAVVHALLRFWSGREFNAARDEWWKPGAEPAGKRPR
jgi:hypothetical protein